MGLLSKIGKGIKKAVKSVGKVVGSVAQVVAPVAALIPGVGTAVSAVAGVVSSVLGPKTSLPPGVTPLLAPPPEPALAPQLPVPVAAAARINPLFAIGLAAAFLLLKK